MTKSMKKLSISVGILFSSILSFAGVFNTTIENDVLYDTDRHYTHGTRFVYMWDKTGKSLGSISGLALGQYMYSPSDISISELMPNDRPYAGWLYLGPIFLARNKNQQDMMELDIGVVGPLAGCEWTQMQIHKLLDCGLPYGWDNQIHNEVGVNLAYQKKFRFRYKNFADIIPSAGGAWGNVATYADLGCGARVGYNLPDDFGFLKMEPTVRVTNKSNFRVYGFTDVGGRSVVKNIFIDGNTFKDSPRVKKNIFVGDLSVGFGIGYGNLDILYSQNTRTKEFEQQEDINRFGTLSISYGF